MNYFFMALILGILLGACSGSEKPSETNTLSATDSVANLSAQTDNGDSLVRTKAMINFRLFGKDTVPYKEIGLKLTDSLILDRAPYGSIRIDTYEGTTQKGMKIKLEKANPDWGVVKSNTEGNPKTKNWDENYTLNSKINVKYADPHGYGFYEYFFKNRHYLVTSRIALGNNARPHCEIYDITDPKNIALLAKEVINHDYGGAFLNDWDKDGTLDYMEFGEGEQAKIYSLDKPNKPTLWNSPYSIIFEFSYGSALLIDLEKSKWFFDLKARAKELGLE